MSSARFIEGIEPGRTVSFHYDGREIAGFEGEDLAGALLRAGIAGTRVTARAHDPRGYFCGMGICWECVLDVEGEGMVRGCGYPVRSGLVVRSVTVRLPEDL